MSVGKTDLSESVAGGPRRRGLAIGPSASSTPSAAAALGGALSRCLPDGLALAWLIAAGIKATWALDRFLDLRLFDETSLYLVPGSSWGPGQPLPPADWGPLFCVWYKALSLFEPDRIRLFYLSYALLSILPPLLFYAVLRACRFPIWVSMIVTTLLLVSRGNMLTDPRVSHFALCVLFVTLTSAQAVRSRMASLCLLCAGTVLASYARPEQYTAFLCLTAYTAFRFWRNRRRLRTADWVAAAGLVAVVAVCGWAFGFPLGGATGRRLVAFSQNFGYAWARKHPSGANPWDWQRTVAETFGPIGSVGEAFRLRPWVFLSHVWDNACAYGYDTVAILGMYAFPRSPFATPYPAAAVVAFPLTCYAVYRLWNRENRFTSALLGRLREFEPVAVGCAACVAACVPACLIVAPRWHVLFLQTPLLVLLVLVLLLRKFGPLPAFRASTWGAIAAGGLLMVPGPDTSIGTGQLANLQTVRFLNSLSPKGRLRVLHMTDGMEAYVSNPSIRMVDFDGDGLHFDQYLRTKGINAVLYAPELNSEAGLDQEGSLPRFRREYARWGFEKFDIAETPRTLYVSRGLMRRPDATTAGADRNLPQ